MTAVGHHLALEFEGADLAAALGRAVEAWAEAVADVHPSLVPELVAVELEGSTPSALLLAVLEECLRRGREGQVAVRLDALVDGGCLRGTVAVVPAADTLPHVLSWREVSLEPAPVRDPGAERDGGPAGWRGRVSA